ncbi:MAG: Sec-independent protein translocase protein TatB [Cellvibrionaceae bacterium]|nr:Sec-independent protein translocase protein TatB [Cellvibrionaceae bacterium]
MGFFEIVLIAIVALIVVGPARMPEAVRSLALTIGRVKRSVNSARAELERQIGADDIRRQLHNEAVMASLDNVKRELADSQHPQAAQAPEQVQHSAQSLHPTDRHPTPIHPITTEGGTTVDDDSPSPQPQRKL